MSQEAAAESALLVTVPLAEPVVGALRARFDPAARVGVPAHASIVYPFKPVELLTAQDVRLLETLFAGTPPYELVLSRTAWFDSEALYLAPEDPRPLIGLTRMIVGAFPAYPPYGGAYAEIVPHVTIGRGEPGLSRDHADLREAEAEVAGSLPIRQPVTAVELWSGPPLGTGRGPWRRVSSFPLSG